MKRSSKICTWILVLSMLFVACSCTKTESTKRDRDDDSDSTRSEIKNDNDETEQESDVTAETSDSSQSEENVSKTYSVDDLIEVSESCLGLDTDATTEQLLNFFNISEYKRMDSGLDGGKTSSNNRELTNFDVEIAVDDIQIKSISIWCGDNRRVYEIDYRMNEGSMAMTEESLQERPMDKDLPVEEAHDYLFNYLNEKYGKPNEIQSDFGSFNADIIEQVDWVDGDFSIAMFWGTHIKQIEGNNYLSIIVLKSGAKDEEALPSPALSDTITEISDLFETAIGSDFNTAKSLFEEFFGKTLRASEPKDKDGYLVYSCTPSVGIKIGTVTYTDIFFYCDVASGNVAEIVFFKDSLRDSKLIEAYKAYIEALTVSFGTPSLSENDEYKNTRTDEYKPTAGNTIYVRTVDSAFYFGCKND